MITIKPYLRTYSKQTEGVVWVRFYINGQKVNFSTGVKTDAGFWSDQKCQVLKSDQLADDKNLVIENIIARINNVFVKYRLKDRKLTRDAFLRAYHRPDDYSTFFDFIKDHSRKLNRLNELATVKVHQTVLSKIKQYAPDLQFDDITSEWLDGYYSYLLKELGNNMNTAYKNMATFKKYVRYAFKKGYMDENPFAEWKIRRVKGSYTYMSEDELSRLIAIYTGGDLEYKYHKTLEFFLFMCFSSLHVTDAKNLRMEQFNDTYFTYFRIKNRNKKPEPVNVPAYFCHLLLEKNKGYYFA